MGKPVIPGLSQEQSQKILNFLKNFNPEEIVLFGSRAKGSFREGSDIDLALKGNLLTLEDRDKILIQYYNLNLPWKLDIVIYCLITEPLLKEHIDQIGLNLS